MLSATGRIAMRAGTRTRRGLRGRPRRSSRRLGRTGRAVWFRFRGCAGRTRARRGCRSRSGTRGGGRLGRGGVRLRWCATSGCGGRAAIADASTRLLDYASILADGIGRRHIRYRFGPNHRTSSFFWPVVKFRMRSFELHECERMEDDRRQMATTGFRIRRLATPERGQVPMEGGERK